MEKNFIVVFFKIQNYARDVNSKNESEKDRELEVKSQNFWKIF